MTFLNAMLLGGVAALAVPLIIHLFNRRRFRKVEWGAMHLLEQVVRVNRKRIKIEQIILLLVRCAIPVLLALAMARPVMTGWQPLPGETASSMIVMLDNSYSMDAGGTGRSNFAEAVDESAAVLGQLRRGSDAAVLLMGGGVESLLDEPTYDTANLTQHLRSLTAGFGPADAAGSLSFAAATIAPMSHAKRDMMIVSDFQRHDWEDVDSPERQRLIELLGSLRVRPSLTFMHVGAEVTDNVAVEDVQLSRRVVGVGQSVNVRARIRNYGDQGYQTLRIYCRVDGEERGVTQIPLGPNEQNQVLFSVEFEEPGSQLIEVAVEAADALRSDNTLQKAVAVLEKIPVLLVDGDRRAQLLESETAFLEIALQPYAAAGAARLADLIETQVVNPDALAEADLDAVRVVVLANVEQLGGETLNRLRQFVEGGGGLMVFPGDRIDFDWYNDVFAAEAGLLPMQMQQLVGGDEEADDAEPMSLVAQRFEHAALETFNDPQQGKLTDGEVQQWYRLGRSAEAATDDRDVTIMARLENGDPLWVERRLGDGAIIQAATTADADWNNFPVRPFFVGLMQEMVTHLATTADPSRNVEAGRPIVAFLPEQLAGERLTLIDPEGGRHAVKAEARNGRAIVAFRRTRRPGLYVLHVPEADPIHFVATTSRRESALQQLNADELEQLAEQFGAEVVQSAEGYAALDHHRRHGRELWKAVLLAALAMLFLEMFFQQRFAKGRA
ncbi:MAG: BatA domain-containing protein [Phycisphaeraceae bacterium]